MPSPEQQDQSLAAATTNALFSLHDAHSCSICHDLLSAPVSLPCSHVFCSECVRRHLSTKSLCPHPTCRKPTTYIQLTPLREYDIALEPLRRTGQKVEPPKLREQKPLVFLSRKACTRAQLMERLRAHDIPTNGGTDAIANRYNEFVIRWNANLDAGVPKSKKSIIAAVLATERGTGKESRRAKGASSFFTRASSVKDEAEIEVPAEGDDFAALVRKTKARMQRKRKLMIATETNEKRVCVTASGQSSKENDALESTAENDGNNGNCEISKVYHGSALSQPEGAQGNREDSKATLAPLMTESKPRNNIVSSQILSIHFSVCGVNIEIDGTSSKAGSSLARPSAKGLQPSEHNTAVIPPLGAIWSQTTPEKQMAPVIDGGEIATARNGQNDMSASKNPLPGMDAFMQDPTISTSPHRNPNANSITPSLRPSPVAFRRPRGPDSLGSQSPREENLKTNPVALSTQLQCRSDTQQNSKYPPERNASFGRTNGEGLPSEDVTPTKAQLERAERSRLAALAKRKRFYERQRQGLSQMRQPDL